MGIRVLEEMAGHIPGMMFAKSRDGRYTYANREYERLFRVKREWLLGKTDHDFMSEELAAAIADHDRQVLTEGVPHRFDEHYLINGEKRIYTCLRFPLRDETGAVSGLAGMAVDTTESRMAEERLKESKARLETLLHAIPDLVIFKDPEGRHLLLNKAAEAFMGLSSPEAAGKANQEVLPRDLAAKCRESDRKALAGQKPIHSDESMVTGTGETIHFDTIKAPILDEIGNQLGLVVVSRDITERKRHEKHLRMSEARFRDFFAHVPVGMFIADRQGRFLHVNGSFCRFLGYGERELLNPAMSFRNITHPDDLAASLTAFNRLIDGAVDEFSLEKRYLRRDGTTAWGRVSATSRSENGSPRYIGIVEDIDDRKRTEEALRDSEERFRMFAAFTYDWEYWISPEGGYIYVSPACKKVSGYGPEHFRDARQFLELVHPEDRELFSSHLRDHLQESPSFTEIEFRIIHRNGEERWLAHACQPVYDKDGRYMGRRASNRDITERKRTGQQMQLFVDLVDQSNDALLVADLQTRLISIVNGKLCRELQYTREELLTMRPDDLSTMPAGFFDDHFRKLRKTGSCLVEDSLRRKDGTTFPVEVSARFTTINDREFAVAVIRDISERRRLEHELQKAQKLESIGLLAGGIAHDFNNILTAILGNITLARMFLPPDEKAAERLAVAEQASMRARGLSQQLLTFAKGGAPITETTAAPRLIQEALNLALRGSPVKEDCIFPDDLWLVEADENQLNQAISNLALNAVQAMPQGGTLAVSATNLPLPSDNTHGLPAGRYIRIDLTDEGIGIPEDAQQKIFDPYFTTKERGSGLGLTISFSIAKRHGGTIIVRSTPGKGSTFSLFLPASHKRAMPLQTEAAGKVVSGTGRILVMDDEETVNDTAAEMLRHLGYRVETVRDGAEAVIAYRRAMAAGDRFDAVITDLTVPAGMGGKETVRHLLDVDPRAKVIVSSGFGNDPILSEYAAFGFKGVMPKPYRLSDLSKTLHEVLGHREGQ